MHRFLFLFCLIIQWQASASPKNINFRDAVRHHMIEVHASAKGGYMGNCLSLRMKNKTQQDLNVYIEPGLIFTPNDTNMQNLVAIGDERLLVAAGKETLLGLNAFCGKSYARCPKATTAYRFWKQGDTGLVSALRFIKTKRLYDGLGQRAVWMFTNQHCINRIYDDSRPTLSQEFVKYLANVTGKEIPEFYIQNKRPLANTEYVYNSEVDHSYVVISWNFRAPRNTHVSIYDKSGSFIKDAQGTEIIDRYGSNMIVKFRPEEYKNGIYIVRLHDDDNNIYVEKKVRVGGENCN